MNPFAFTIMTIFLVAVILGPFYEWALTNSPIVAILFTIAWCIYKYISWQWSKFSDVNKRFDKVDEQSIGVHKKFIEADTKSEKKFMEADAKLEMRSLQVDHRFEKVETRLDQHQVSIDVLDKKVTSLQEDVTKINHKLISIDAKVEVLKERFDGLEVRFDGVEKKLEKMEDKFDKRFERMENIMLAVLESNRKFFGQNYGPAEPGLTKLN